MYDAHNNRDATSDGGRPPIPSEDAFVDDMLRHGNKVVALELGIAAVIQLVAQLQLALRHPENVGPSAEWASAFARDLIAEASVTDRIRAVLEAGWTQ